MLCFDLILGLNGRIAPKLSGRVQNFRLAMPTRQPAFSDSGETPELLTAAVLRGWTLGGEQRSFYIHQRLCRDQVGLPNSLNRSLSGRMLGMILSQLVSKTAVRAQAMCMLARIITLQSTLSFCHLGLIITEIQISVQKSSSGEDANL